jgi:hypothetical protein
MPSNRERVRVTVREACEAIEDMFAADVRQQIVASLRSPNGMQESLARLRRGMRSHAFARNGTTHSLARVVQALDHRTKAEGFHVLESWDYVGHKFADQIVPVLMLDRCAATSGESPSEDRVLSILLDQYLLSVLGLVVVRAWDDPEPDAVFDQVTRLLQTLGDSSRFVDDAATLMLLAVSHYHPQEAAYDVLVDRIATLDEGHRLSFALACAPVLSGHFRWGLRFMYQRDFGRLRDDNVVDYPWLLLSMRTLAEAYCQSSEASTNRPAIVEGLLSGLSADPWLFAGKAPPCLGGREAEHGIVRVALEQARDELVRDLEAIRPSPSCYSPLGFEVNFLCNALVAMVATAVGDGEPHPSLNALLANAQARGVPAAQLEPYARSLMNYASGGRGAAAGSPGLIVYDPQDAQHAYNLTMRVLRGG